MSRDVPSEADLATTMAAYITALGRDIAQVLRREGIEIGPWLRGEDPSCNDGRS